MPFAAPDPRIEQKQLPCGCAVVLAVQQQEPCRHNAGSTLMASLTLNKCNAGAMKTVAVIAAMIIASSSSVDTATNRGVGCMFPLA